MFQGDSHGSFCLTEARREQYRVIDWRPIRFEDFEAFWEVTHREPFQTIRRERILGVWAKLLRERRMRGVVIQDFSGSGRPRIVAVGATVFISDQFCSELATRRVPYLLPRVLLSAESAGSPILNELAIARGNAGAGLNLAVVHLGWKKGLSLEDFSAVMKLMPSSFQQLHQGYKLTAMWAEHYGTFELGFCLASGSWVVQDDFRDYYDAGRAPRPKAAEHPFLLRATREEIRPATITAAMFVFSSPAMALTRLQKSILEEASSGCTNRQIGDMLGLTEDNVRRTFRRVYANLAKNPALYSRIFSETGGATSTTHAARRGALISYIQSHNEELRPWPRRAPLNSPADKPIRFPTVENPTPAPDGSIATMATFLNAYRTYGT